MILWLKSAIIVGFQVFTGDNLAFTVKRMRKNTTEPTRWCAAGPNLKTLQLALGTQHLEYLDSYWKIGAIEIVHFRPLIISNTSSCHQKTPHQHPPLWSWTTCMTLYPVLFGSFQAPTGLDADDEVRIVLNDFEHHDQQHLLTQRQPPGQLGVRTGPPERGSKCIPHSWRNGTLGCTTWMHKDWSGIKSFKV